ncbi:MAG: hypothetical protein PVI01_09365 [Gemmatimonadales bacterium]
MPRSAATPLPPAFRTVVLTVVPDAVTLDESGWTELEQLVRRALSTRPPDLRRRIRLFMHLVRWLPLLRYGRPLTALDAMRRERFLRSLQEHRLDAIRLGFWGLRTLALLGYYGRSGAADSIGYRPDPVGWEAAR